MTITTPLVVDQTLFTFTPLTGFEQARGLVAAIQHLSLAQSIPEIQWIVRTAARQLTGADGSTFVLREDGCCYYADEDAISPLWKGQRFPMSACISGWAMLNRSLAVIEDIYADDRIPHDAYRPTFVKSLAMVPIRTLDPIGAIGNYWATRHRPTEQELELLQALADSTAVALENVRVTHELETSCLDMLQRLALVVEAHDDVTHQHTERVARTAAGIAERIGLSPADVALIRQAAPLHDIGKLAVSDAILAKSAPLTKEEVAELRRHPAVGAAILSGSTSEVLRLAGEIAHTHHEWWDGTGYPAGLAGEAIPVSGRIVALADVFDALTQERPYKRAWPLAEALAEIRRLSGRQFDPAIVEAFGELDASELIHPVALQSARSQII